jgi:hypothetical protein
MVRSLLVLTLAAGSLVLAACGGEAGGDRESATTIPGWKTDASKRSVSLDEFRSGGPPRDGIPPIDDPKLLDVADADRQLDDTEPVMVVELDGRARAYPLRIMVWHEIVNDRLAGRPIAVTFCPLCNSAVVFDRRVGGRELTFGTTGKLRQSDLVMWDRQTESWWQQFSGEALVGEMTGTILRPVASRTLSWRDFKRAFAQGTVLSQDTGVERPYGRNPYEGYDADADEQPFLLDGEADRRLPPKGRVLLIRAGGASVAIPFTRLRRDRVVAGDVGDAPFVGFFAPGVRSALDRAAIADSRDVGSATAYDPRVDGRLLRFDSAGRGVFVDAQTSSRWDLTGRAVDGPLKGRRLRPLHHDQQFWFAVAAFLPDVRILR